MSSGDAGPAQQGDAGQQQGGQASGEQQEAAGPDFSRLMAGVESMTASQEEMRQFLASEPWKPAPEAAGEEDGSADFDLSSLLGEDPDLGFDPERFAQGLAPLIDQVTDRKVQAALAPIQETQQNDRITREAQMLVDEFPDLGDPEIGPQVVAHARQTAEAYGHPDLGGEPWFWRMTYMAGRAAQAARDDGGESPDAAHLEGGAGARPGAQQVDMAAAIVGAGQKSGRQALPFG